MKFKKITSNIFAVEAKTSIELAKLFLRFQEYYESPKFRNQIFTLEQYKAWYQKKRKTSTFTYYTDWTGFNVPSYVFTPFYDKQFLNVSKQEHWLLKKLKKNHWIGKLFYVLGYTPKEKSVKKHELAHAKYYTDVRYRQRTNDILYELELSPLKKHLNDLGGYHRSVLLDECHAYILADKCYLKTHSLWTKDFEVARKLFERNFKA